MYSDNILAHIGKGRVQTLEEHSGNVADLSAGFASACGLNADHMRQIAEFHDYGKATMEFQNYIRGNGERISHSNLGGTLLLQKDRIGSFCVLGHHTGIPNEGSIADEGVTLYGRTQDTDGLHELVPRPPVTPFMSEKTDRNLDAVSRFFRYAMETRMYFSCLVDADWQDSAGTVEHVPADCWDTVYGFFFSRTENMFRSMPDTEINRLRTQIFNQCREAGKTSVSKVFSLSAPTGSGKTLASMAFALERVKRGDAKRIIYCIPYTSIIEQNAEVYRSVFGPNNVLEHHHLADYGKKSQELGMDEAQYRSWTVENWDSPIVLTTNVQFFESLLSNRPNRCRKLHNIADSVIVLDEAQMLPLGFLTPCREILKLLAEQYGCTVVLCTATQSSLRIGEEGNEILSDPLELHKSFRRVKITDIRTPFVLDGLADTLSEKVLSEKKNVLCVVNRRRTVQQLFGRLEKAGVKCYHLSLNMCAVHLMDTIKEIKAHLETMDVPICVVSTSLIEAGVDLSFDVGYRELNGLDRIIQTAGRVNRNAVSDMEDLFVFRLAGTKYGNPQKTITGRILRNTADASSPQAVSAYFDELYSYHTPQVHDKKRIMQGTRHLEFQTVAENANMIDDNTVGFFVPYDDVAAGLLGRIADGEKDRSVWRALQRYVVNVHKNVFDRLSEDGKLEEVMDGVYILSDMTVYDSMLGIVYN